MATAGTVFFAISAYSAIHDNCANCSWKLPPEVSSTMTNVEVLLQQDTVWPMYWGLFFCSLFKQQSTFPVIFCLQLLDVILKLTAGWSVWLKLHFTNNSGFWLFVTSWSSLYLSLKFFQFLGRRRAQLMYDFNAKNIEVAFTELREAEIEEPTSQFGKFLALHSSEPHASQSTFFGIFARKQQNLERTSQAEMKEVIVSEAASKSGDNRREEAQPLKRTTQEVQTTSHAKTTDKFQNIRISIEDIFKAEKSLQGEVLQVQSSFEKLIQDAEFINDVFQEWVSSWLSGGPDFDAVQKYIYQVSPQRTESKSSFKNLSEKISAPIKGVRIRGPLKHVDRAIAKVSLFLKHFHLGIQFS
jgi:hypothetical protein